MKHLLGTFRLLLYWFLVCGSLSINDTTNASWRDIRRIPFIRMHESNAVFSMYIFEWWRQVRNRSFSPFFPIFFHFFSFFSIFSHFFFQMKGIIALSTVLLNTYFEILLTFKFLLCGGWGASFVWFYYKSIKNNASKWNRSYVILVVRIRVNSIKNSIIHRFNYIIWSRFSICRINL